MAIIIMVAVLIFGIIAIDECVFKNHTHEGWGACVSWFMMMALLTLLGRLLLLFGDYWRCS